MKLETIIRQDVEYMPKQLAPGILYVSEKYETAAHLCACGCGAKIRTPLGPTEWVVRPDTAGPSLWPSVGNWQRPCQSHYIIESGNIIWCGKWTPEQVAAGRFHEETRRRAFYNAMYAKKVGWKRFWLMLKSLLGIK